jgi:hypothetical protein
MMMVGIKSPQGQQLIDAILADKAVFPNAVSARFDLCKLLGQQYNPSLADKLEQAAVGRYRTAQFGDDVELFNAGSILNRSAAIVKHIQNYLADFEANQPAYRLRTAMPKRLRCAIMATDFLSRNFRIKRRNDPEE